MSRYLPSNPFKKTPDVDADCGGDKDGHRQGEEDLQDVNSFPHHFHVTLHGSPPYRNLFSSYYI